MKPELTQEGLKSVLSYDKHTGVFRWLIDSGRAHPGVVAGTFDAYGYRNIKVAGRVMKAHRLAWLYEAGELPPAEIDHINGDRADNRIANLRLATVQENRRNRHAVGRNKTSRFLGVSWMASKSKWRAAIGLSGKFKHLGVFDCEVAASEAYQAARKQLFGEFA